MFSVFFASSDAYKADFYTMENVVPSTTEDNCVEHRERTSGENNEVVKSGSPANVVIDHSNNVIVERLNCDTNIEIKKENCHEFPADEDESLGDGEPQGDETNPREYQSRKNISTLTSKHYAGHVRVFKGIVISVCGYFKTKKKTKKRRKKNQITDRQWTKV